MTATHSMQSAITLGPDTTTARATSAGQAMGAHAKILMNVLAIRASTVASVRNQDASQVVRRNRNLVTLGATADRRSTPSRALVCQALQMAFAVLGGTKSQLPILKHIASIVPPAREGVAPSILTSVCQILV
jgi:hypothetical protein